MSNTDDLVVIEIQNCARCGKAHTGISFAPFEISPIEDSDGTMWTHWGICPETMEPILFRNEEK